MRFSAIVLAAAAVSSVEARDPKYAAKPTGEMELKAIRPKFTYPTLNEVATKGQEKKNKKKHVFNLPNWYFSPYYQHQHPGYSYYPQPHPHAHYVPHHPDLLKQRAHLHVPYAGGPSQVHIPVVPTYTQWMSPKYLVKLHNKTMKKRYVYARNHCMRKNWSGRRRYRCFALHWAEFQPGSPNNLHDIRSRVQADCMRYRD
jgi:hypothetical protein